MKNLAVILLFMCLHLNLVYSQIISKDSLNTILEHALQDDQKYRLTLESVSFDVSQGSEYMEILQKMTLQDLENRKIVFPVIDLIRKYNIDSLSDAAYRGCYLVVQHAAGPDQVKYSAFISWLHRLHKISNTEFMWFTDRLHVRQQKAQIYGLQSTQFESGDIMLYPITRGYDEKWKEIGEEIPLALWQNFTKEYAPVILEAGEFLIFGHIKIGNMKGIAGLEKSVVIQFDTLPLFSPNENVFYRIRVLKNNIPGSVGISYAGKEINAKITTEKAWDFVNLTYQFILK